MVTENNEQQINTESAVTEPAAPAPSTEAPVTETSTEPVITPVTPEEETVTETTEADAPVTQEGTQTQTVDTADTPVAENTDQVGDLTKQLEETKKQQEVLQRQIMQNEVEKQRQAIETEARKYNQALIDQGMDELQAQQLTEQLKTSRQKEVQHSQNIQNLDAYYQGKMNAAMEIGEKHGVSPKQLMNYNTPEEMEKHASSQSKVAKLEAEVARLKKEQVPPQQMDTSQAPAEASSSEDRLLDRYNAGDRSPEAINAAKRILGL
tara:strand:+ start:1166 stop:1960 length:795 start_codon:yes stop_codon:yes gene_type:complete